MFILLFGLSQRYYLDKFICIILYSK